MTFSKTNHIGFLFLFLAFSTALSAQVLSIGPRAGFQYTNLTGDGADTEFRTGWTAGLTSTFSVFERTGLTVDLLFSVEGSADSPDRLDMQYLRLPVYFDLFFRDLGEVFRPKVYAGIVPGYLLHAEQSTTDLTDIFRDFDVGLSAGAGFNYQVAEQTWITVDLRYMYGLTDVYAMTFGNPGTARNQQLQLSAGLVFGR